MSYPYQAADAQERKSRKFFAYASEVGCLTATTTPSSTTKLEELKTSEPKATRDQFRAQIGALFSSPVLNWGEIRVLVGRRW